ncbi:NAD(P)/FAD-dependent oxidoreductase [Aquincola tertiaricarbonis]|uniref:Ferredoxin--NADP reductase n=1 Tax=Aquincola tertiaricarbonis TaxID=391953 RepID=A0ABY4SEW8_AQUTE|nr:NAD(P)/FAD-dependent oxidoreductase [Aquincola tertiaricarbonis]URI11125.1 NAD(P)/FAD-dependent oxidoreductase [Aquincola tertiaricarbonis]
MIETDALIVGAGPVGLFQVFELGLLEIGAHVVDSLPQPGGQCIELYPDKPIYDIPGLPATSGRELVDRLLQQIAPFQAPLHLDQEVSLLQRRPDGRFDVATRRGLQFIAKTVFIAGGVGAFQPKPLRVEGLAAFEGTQLHYRVDDPARFAGRHVVVVGGGDSALQWANHLAETGPQAAASVTLLHRRDAFQAEPAAIDRMRALCEAQRLQFAAGQVSGIEVTDGRLTAIKVLGGDGVTRVMPLDELLVFFGLSPRLGPIADWGLALERKQLVVDTEKFETSEPGIFAVGDVVTYPGKKKLILCGFHEATLAAFGAVRHVFPDKAVHLQYTTTSPRLHQLLGVETPGHDDEH